MRALRRNRRSSSIWSAARLLAPANSLLHRNGPSPYFAPRLEQRFDPEAPSGKGFGSNPAGGPLTSAALHHDFPGLLPAPQSSGEEPPSGAFQQLEKDCGHRGDRRTDSPDLTKPRIIELLDSPVRLPTIAARTGRRYLRQSSLVRYFSITVNFREIPFLLSGKATIRLYSPGASSLASRYAT